VRPGDSDLLFDTPPTATITSPTWPTDDQGMPRKRWQVPADWLPRTQRQYALPTAAGHAGRDASRRERQQRAHRELTPVSPPAEL